MPRTKKASPQEQAAKPKTQKRPGVAKAIEPQSTREQLSSIIKSARDLMRKDAGLSGDLDRLPQLSWVLFLKCYDDMEQRREVDMILQGQKYRPVIPKPFQKPHPPLFGATSSLPSHQIVGELGMG